MIMWEMAGACNPILDRPVLAEHRPALRLVGKGVLSDRDSGLPIFLMRVTYLNGVNLMAELDAVGNSETPVWRAGVGAVVPLAAPALAPQVLFPEVQSSDPAPMLPNRLNKQRR